MNGLSIFITLKDNVSDLDKILAEIFETNSVSPFEILVLDYHLQADTKEIIKKYSTKCFIRHIRNSNSANLDEDLLKKKAGYEQILNIASIDDVYKFKENKIKPFKKNSKSNIQVNNDYQNTTNTQLSDNKNHDAQQPSSIEELQQENELLLLQLHQVQEELEEYYLKYQDLKNRESNMQASMSQDK